MANEIKIAVDVLTKDAAKELDSFLNNIKFQTLQLETAFKKGSISSAELGKALVKLETDVKSYGVSTLKTEATIRAITNSQLRAKEGFTSLGGKLNEINSNITGKTNPAFISFNQIIQDAPFGIRGVGNNIQFLTQQFTTLRASGMSTTDILKGMLKNALTPMGGLMLAVSAGTTLLTLAMDLLGQKSESAKEKTQDLTDSIAELEMQTKHISEGQYLQYLQQNILDAKKAYEEALKPQSNYIDQMIAWGKWLVNNPIGRALQNIWLWIEYAASGYRKLLGLITPGGGAVSGTFDFSIIDEQYKKLLEAEKKYQDEVERRRKEADKKLKDSLKEDSWLRPSKNFLSGSFTNPQLSNEPAISPMRRSFIADALAYDAKVDIWRQSKTAKEYLDLWDKTEKEKLAARERAVDESAAREEEIYKTMARVGGAGARAIFDSIFDAMNNSRRRDERKEDRIEREKYQREVDRINKTVKNEEQKRMELQAAEDRYYDRMDQLDMQRHSIWNNAWMAMRNTAINALEAVLQKMTELFIFKQLLNLGSFGAGSVIPDFVGESIMPVANTVGGAGSSTGIAIAAASRAAASTKQHIYVSGKLVGNGRDLHAIFEYAEIDRNTRSMKISKR